MDSPTPRRRGRPPKAMAQPLDRIAQLTAREKALAIKARARHRYTLDLPLELYEALLTQAEDWEQPLPDVVRACIRSGLDSIKRFGGASPTNPFAYGSLNPPTQADLDPTGYGWPPTGPAHAFVPTQWIAPPPINQQPELPGPLQFVGPEYDRNLLPSGATIDLGGTAHVAPAVIGDPRAFGDDNDE